MDDHLQRASVTLLISDDDLVPEEVTALLGCEPNTGVRKGDSFVAHNGRAITARTGKWHLSTGYREPPNIDQQITELLGSLPDSLAIWSDLTSRFHCYVSVGLYFADDSWTGGFTIEPKTLLMLGERRLAIDFDIYAPGASK